MSLHVWTELSMNRACSTTRRCPCPSFPTSSGFRLLWYVLVFVLCANSMLSRKVHTPKAGEDAFDKTSFHPSNHHFGPLRADRAPLLFQLHKFGGHGQIPPTFMQFAGKYVLDQDDHRIRAFPELPATLSTALEGHDIEYFRRRNDHIDYIDLIGMYIQFIFSRYDGD